MLFTVGIVTLIIAIFIPFSLTRNEINYYSLDDYESTRDYHNFDRPTCYSEMTLGNLSDGKLLIQFFQNGDSTRTGPLFLKLLNGDNEEIWDFEGSPTLSFGVIRDIYTIDINEGNYILTIECDYMHVLELSVRHINDYSFKSIPFCCCCTPSAFSLSMIIIAFSLVKKKKK